MGASHYRDKKVVSVFVRFRAPFHESSCLERTITTKSITIYDLTRFGPNLHHFAVESVNKLRYKTPRGQIQLKGLKRPVVVVLDSELTVYIF
jgi:hypothetical protein